METTSLKISDTLYLVTQQVSKSAPAKKVEVPTNHILAVDCSGSMYGDLPKLKEQLKRKLPKLIGDNDTLSIIWFSGRGECDVLLEAEPVSTLKDLSDANRAIDKWLRCVGLTGFKEPLEKVADLVKRVSKKRPGSVFSLFFMSDGCDNQWSRPDILKAVETAAGGLASATFVEYGYYADRPLLTVMAEKAGGQLIFADDFDKYEASFEAAMQNRPTGAPKIEVKVQGDAVEGVVWTADGKVLTTYGVSSGAVNVAEDTSAVYYLSASAVGAVKTSLSEVARFQDASTPQGSSNQGTEEALSAAYAAISLMSVRMKPKVVLPVLKALGDVSLVEMFSGCFGKQKYSAFMDASKDMAFTPALRFSKGYDPNKVPRDDAFTVLELLQILSDDENNKVLLDHPEFKYSKVGRGRVDASDVLTPEELDEVQKLTARIASEKSAKKIKELQEQISAITSKKQEALKFEQDAEEAKKGFSISSLTWNETKPNVSILVKKSGTVDVSSRIPDSLKGKVPEQFPTFVWRNYAIIKDGLINVGVLPVELSKETRARLEAAVKDGSAPADLIATHGDGETLLNVGKLPVINQNMVNDVDPADFFRREWELLKAQAEQKVYNSLQKELLPAAAVKGFADTYGPEAADWLREQGITDGSGFSPKTVQAEAKDMYLAKELKVSLKGYSKLPSLKELKEMIEKSKNGKGKVNPPGALMQPFYEEADAFLKSPAYVKAAAKDQVLKAWLEGQQKDARKRTRQLIYEIARTTFTLIVGQVWFKGWKPEDSTLVVKDGDLEITGIAEMREVEVKI